MCGRFAAFWDDQAIGYRLDADLVPGLPGPSWNIAPTRTVAVAVQGRDGVRRLAPAYWSLLPPDAPTPRPGYPTFNARSETALTRPTYRAAADGFRAILPANGYYEWDAGHHPWYFAAQGDVLWLAGLCSWWRDPATGRWTLTTTILTRDALGRAARVHDRMPLLVPDALIPAWLDRRTPGREVFPAVQESAQEQEEALDAHEVAALHGDGPRLLDPVTATADDRNGSKSQEASTHHDGSKSHDGSIHRHGSVPTQGALWKDGQNEGL